jgi:hypothetical protein
VKKACTFQDNYRLVPLHLKSIHGLSYTPGVIVLIAVATIVVAGWYRKKHKSRSVVSGFRIWKMEATTGFEPVMRVLQTPALPLGYVAVSAYPAIRIRPAELGRTRSKLRVGAEEEI